MKSVAYIQETGQWEDVVNLSDYEALQSELSARRKQVDELQRIRKELFKMWDAKCKECFELRKMLNESINCL